jgi:hypothetical protein
MVRTIHYDPGRTKQLIAATVTTLGDFDDRLIRLKRVMSNGNRLVPVRIERHTNVSFRLDAVMVEQPP